MLSDGLASVSVYVEAGAREGLRGAAHVGAINAWGGLIGQYQVTAVGEVPAGTVKSIVGAMRHRDTELDG